MESSALSHVRQVIDNKIDARRRYAPSDTSDIRVNFSGEEVIRSLGHPFPPGCIAYSCLYRGFRVVSIPAEKMVQARRRRA